MNRPLVVLTYNRPNKTKLLFEVLRRLKPSLLILSSDGPKDIIDKKKVESCREIFDEYKKYWSHDQIHLFSDENNGCGEKVVSTLNFTFQNFNEAIILEDDCLPSLTFFQFMDYCLEKFRQNLDIMHINGSNMYSSNTNSPDSYDCSRFANVWGWATWANRWSKYEFSVSNIEKELSIMPTDVINFRNAQVFWKVLLEKVYKREIDTWDFQWIWTVLKCKGLCITPNLNLVKNIGFDDEATHCGQKYFELYNRTADNIKLPIKDPPFLAANFRQDLKYLINFYQIKPDQFFESIHQKVTV